MGIVQLIMGFQTVKRFVNMGACQISIPVKWNANNVPEPGDPQDWIQELQPGRLKWDFLSPEKTQGVGEEPDWTRTLEKTHTQVKELKDPIHVLDNISKAPYYLSNPGMVNGQPAGTQISALNPYQGVEVDLKLQQVKEKNPLKFINQ